MLDVPRIGLDYLNGALTHIAETSEDADHYEACDALIESCRTLVGSWPLKKALTATALDADDLLRRERDVVRSLMEIQEVRRML